MISLHFHSLLGSPAPRKEDKLDYNRPCEKQEIPVGAFPGFDGSRLSYDGHLFSPRQRATPATHSGSAYRD